MTELPPSHTDDQKVDPKRARQHGQDAGDGLKWDVRSDGPPKLVIVPIEQ